MVEMCIGLFEEKKKNGNQALAVRARTVANRSDSPIHITAAASRELSNVLMMGKQLIELDLFQ